MSDLSASEDPDPLATSPPSAADGDDNGRVLGNYVLRRCIGGGAMGDVFLAQHRKLQQRLYAIKLIREGLVSGEACDRFEREIETMGQLSHPNLVFATDAGSCDGQLYLVMEYIEGRDLQAIVDQAGPLPVAEAAEIIRLACLGLEHAHASHIIHRDVKPSNIILSVRGEVKVLDLGLAALQDSAAQRLTADGSTMGTAAYMSPEQWQDAGSASDASDIYSIGCALYCLLTGKPPFGWESPLTLAGQMRAHLAETPVPATVRRTGIPRELSDLIGQLLAKDCRARPPSAGAVANRLEPFCDHVDQSRLSQWILQLDPGTHSEASVQSSALRPTQQFNWSRNRQPEASSARMLTIGGLVMLISAVSLIMAYYGPESTVTWRTRFDRLGDSAVPAGVGFVIELVRMIIFVGLTCFVVGTRFTDSIRKTFDVRLWTIKLLASRIAIILLVGFFVHAESVRHLDLSRAPEALAAWGIERGIATTAAAEAGPYRWYLPYSLINYIVVLVGLFAFPLVRFWLSDYSYMLRQLDRFVENQQRSEYVDAAVRNLQRFAYECHKLVVRYVDVLGSLCVGIQFEYWIGKWTLTDAGMNTAVVGWTVVALAGAFVVAISHVYGCGFMATSRLIAEQGSLEGESALSRLSLAWFLKTTLLYQIGGIAILSLVLVAAHASLD